MTGVLSTIAARLERKGFTRKAALIALAYLFWNKFIRPRLRFSLKGKVVVITGCGGGIGAACARKFVQEGAIVYAAVRRQASIDEWHAFNKERGANAPGELIPIMMDVTSDKQVEDAIQVISQRKEPLAALVNNAAVSAFGFAECLPLDRFRQCIEANYLGTVRVTKAFAPLLRRHRARMIMVGSVGDRNPAGFGSAYLSSKAAVAWFTECFRQEMSRFGVRVCLVEPGFFSSGLLTSGSSNGREESVAEGDVGKAYGGFNAMMDEVQKPIEFMEKLNGGFDGMERVCGGAVVDAACERFPLTRRVVGVDAKLILWWVPYLPTWLLDAEFAMRHRKIHPISGR